MFIQKRYWLFSLCKYFHEEITCLNNIRQNIKPIKVKQQREEYVQNGARTFLDLLLNFSTFTIQHDILLKPQPLQTTNIRIKHQYYKKFSTLFSINGIKDGNFYCSNICSLKKDTNFSSNTPLGLVSFFTEQTLLLLDPFYYIYTVLHIFDQFGLFIM